ncbi:MAG: hypothetical protein KAI72_02995, partial [Candidatus Pacebacteria bacterium]|nr:hypothetical protein [Candidatus Paceibacterota bacterium]
MMNIENYNRIYYPTALIFSVFLFFIIFASIARAEEKTPELIYIDHDYIDIKVSKSKKQNSYKISAESKDGGGADWLVYVIRLNENEISSHKDFQLKIDDNNRVKYLSEADVVEMIYVPSKSYFRYVDIPEIIIETVVGKVFDNEDTATISVNDNSIYLIRAYSGALGIIDDRTERQSIKDEIDFGEERLQEAVMANIISGGFDAASLIIPATSLLDDADAKKIIIISFKKAAVEIYLLTNIKDPPPGADEFLMALNKVSSTVILDVTQYLAKKTAKEAQKGALKKLGSFLSKSADIALKSVNFSHKVSKLGQIADRIYTMTLSATPSETSYIVNKKFEEQMEEDAQDMDENMDEDTSEIDDSENNSENDSEETIDDDSNSQSQEENNEQANEQSQENQNQTTNTVIDVVDLREVNISE